MEFVTVNYNKNKEYFVERKVLVDVVFKKLKEFKGIKVKDVKVNIVKNNVCIDVELDYLKGTLSKILPELHELINFKVMSLTNSKPDNINISINEVR